MTGSGARACKESWTGNRAKAVAAYHDFRALLAKEVGTDPEPETEALYLKILD
ncbi:MAG: hypothetical protein J4O10_07155 [Chloroflexi bacterium]|nr:hypothetical protein [Chloroflexota bacterium]